MAKVKKAYDVLVAGGGPAGIVAALAAARQGAKTILVEQMGYLGGEVSTGLPLATFHTMGGVRVIDGYPQEIVERLVKVGGSLGHISSPNSHVGTMTPIYPEPFKYICERMLMEAGADLLFHSKVAGTLHDVSATKGVIVANKNGLEEIEAKAIVDSTGDGDVFGFAQVPHVKGRSEDGLMQSMTTMFTLANVDIKSVAMHFKDSPYYAHRPGEDDEAQVHFAGSLGKWQKLCPEAPSFSHDEHMLWAMCLRPGELTLNLTDMAGFDGTKAEDLTQAEIEGRRQIFAFYDFLKGYVPGFVASYISNIASHVGVRETRRLLGQYTITRDDVLHSAKFDDAVAKAAYPFDNHDPEGKGTFIEKLPAEVAYDIPYRALIPMSWQGLIVAGRCISATHEAMSATRTMATCMAMGQAAGTAAAMSANYNIPLEKLSINDLQVILRKERVCLE